MIELIFLSYFEIVIAVALEQTVEFKDDMLERVGLLPRNIPRTLHLPQFCNNSVMMWDYGLDVSRVFYAKPFTAAVSAVRKPPGEPSRIPSPMLFKP